MTLLHPFRKLTCLIVLLAASLQAQAQGKMLSMEDAILNSSLQPENLKELIWVAGTDDFVYIDQQDGAIVLMRGSATSNQRNQVLTLSKLSKAWEATGTQQLSSFPTLYWANGNTLVVEVHHSLYKYNLNSDKATVVTTFSEEADYTELDPTLQRVVYPKATIYIYPHRDRRMWPLTDEANVAVMHGQAAHPSTKWTRRNRTLKDIKRQIC